MWMLAEEEGRPMIMQTGCRTVPSICPQDQQMWESGWLNTASALWSENLAVNPPKMKIQPFFLLNLNEKITIYDNGHFFRASFIELAVIQSGTTICSSPGTAESRARSLNLTQSLLYREKYIEKKSDKWT